MAKKLTAMLLCALLALAPALSPVLAEGGAILDGRWLNADIQGNVTEDTPALLKDDFGLFVNKDWILQAQIPAGEFRTGALADVSRTLMDRQIALMQDDSLTGHDAELVHKLYALVSDWNYRDAQGVRRILITMPSSGNTPLSRACRRCLPISLRWSPGTHIRCATCGSTQRWRSSTNLPTSTASSPVTACMLHRRTG